MAPLGASWASLQDHSNQSIHLVRRPYGAIGSILSFTAGPLEPIYSSCETPIWRHWEHPELHCRTTRTNLFIGSDAHMAPLGAHPDHTILNCMIPLRKRAETVVVVNILALLMPNLLPNNLKPLIHLWMAILNQQWPVFYCWQTTEQSLFLPIHVPLYNSFTFGCV